MAQHLEGDAPRVALLVGEHHELPPLHEAREGEGQGDRDGPHQREPAVPQRVTTAAMLAPS